MSTMEEDKKLMADELKELKPKKKTKKQKKEEEKVVHDVLKDIQLDEAVKEANEDIDIKSEYVSEEVEASDVSLDDFREIGFFTIGIPNGDGDTYPVQIEISKDDSDKDILKKMGQLRGAFKAAMLFLELEIARLMKEEGDE